MTLKEMVELDDVQALIARGQEQGFLSIDEVATSLEGLDLDDQGAEDVIKHLDELGVELLEEADARERMAQLADEADRPRSRLNLNRVRDAVTFREIQRVPEAIRKANSHL